MHACDVSAPFTPPSGTQAGIAGRRADSRLRLGAGLPCRLVLLSGTLTGRVEDISATGARIAVAAIVASGSEGVLEVNGVEAFGEIVWCRSGRVGFHFEEKLALEQLVRLRHFSDGFGEHERMRRERIAHEFVTGRRV
ncbi:PilZ domain-containing protein [Novosphingobium olei]|uniref:PilZ domain-containing protein n=1 Tax=Novosphingobium olei TaxID=2728851 RepID=UPI003093BC4C|nr:PilZ domain-containing protein [Novosphingobium olei]